MTWCSMTAQAALLLLALVLGSSAHALKRGPPLGPYKAAGKLAGTHAATSVRAGERPLIEQCKVYYRNATLDHFSWVWFAACA